MAIHLTSLDTSAYRLSRSFLVMPATGAKHGFSLRLIWNTPDDDEISLEIDLPGITSPSRVFTTHLLPRNRPVTSRRSRVASVHFWDLVQHEVCHAALTLHRSDEHLVIDFRGDVLEMGQESSVDHGNRISVDERILIGPRDEFGMLLDERTEGKTRKTEDGRQVIKHEAIFGLLPADVIPKLGKPTSHGNRWLTREQILVTEDWTSPITFVRLVNRDETMGSHAGIWFGSGLGGQPAAFTGVYYGSRFRPLAIGSDSFATSIHREFSPSRMKNLYYGAAWHQPFKSVVPDPVGPDLETEFSKSPLFLRLNDPYPDALTDFLRVHARILSRMQETRDSYLATEIFGDVHDLLSTQHWLRYATRISSEAGPFAQVRAIETAIVLHRKYGDGRMGSPEIYCYQRALCSGIIHAMGAQLPEWFMEMLGNRITGCDKSIDEALKRLGASDQPAYLRLSALNASELGPQIT